MAKHYQLNITDDAFTCTRNQDTGLREGRQSGDYDGRRCDKAGVMLIRLPPLGATALRSSCDATERSRSAADGLRGFVGLWGASAVRAANHCAVFALAERTG
jgi:hypothetical protein